MPERTNTPIPDQLFQHLNDGRARKTAQLKPIDLEVLMTKFWFYNPGYTLVEPIDRVALYAKSQKTLIIGKPMMPETNNAPKKSSPSAEMCVPIFDSKETASYFYPGVTPDHFKSCELIELLQFSSKIGMPISYVAGKKIILISSVTTKRYADLAAEQVYFDISDHERDIRWVAFREHLQSIVAHNQDWIKTIETSRHINSFGCDVYDLSIDVVDGCDMARAKGCHDALIGKLNDLLQSTRGIKVNVACPALAPPPPTIIWDPR